ncbi:MAG: hypothetical protein KUG77_04105 [Nannocystaceae bacterium]|nr:hypothetical protein [Nannocystaceae bacterium]
MSVKVAGTVQSTGDVPELFDVSSPSLSSDFPDDAFAVDELPESTPSVVASDWAPDVDAEVAPDDVPCMAS